MRPRSQEHVSRKEYQTLNFKWIQNICINYSIVKPFTVVARTYIVQILGDPPLKTKMMFGVLPAGCRGWRAAPPHPEQEGVLPLRWGHWSTSGRSYQVRSKSCRYEGWGRGFDPQPLASPCPFFRKKIFSNCYHRDILLSSKLCMCVTYRTGRYRRYRCWQEKRGILFQLNCFLYFLFICKLFAQERLIYLHFRTVSAPGRTLPDYNTAVVRSLKGGGGNRRPAARISRTQSRDGAADHDDEETQVSAV